MDSPSGGQPELIDNRERYSHGEALEWLAAHYPLPLRAASGYVRLGGLHALAQMPGPADRPVRLLLGAMPDPGLGEDSPIDEARQVNQLFERALERLRRERDFDAFPPSRRLQALAAVDDFLRAPRVEVRRYAPRFLHGKTYILSSDPHHEAAPGAALVTSANLTRGGLSGNLELGLARYDPWLVREAANWFDGLWAEAEPFKDELLDLLLPPPQAQDPETIFLRALLELYGDEFAEVDPPPVTTLAEFQRDGYERARYIVDAYGGVIYADGVGTGKTFIGVEFVRDYARERGLYTLVVAPAQLRDTTWVQALRAANLPHEVVSYQELAADEQLADPSHRQRQRVLSLNKDAYRLILVDEAHAFRNRDTTWYGALHRLLGGEPKHLVLLTATPVNNSLWDLYHQIMLFARAESRFAGAPLRVRDLKQFFVTAGANEPESASHAKLFPLLDAVAVRRDRRFLQERYQNAAFPDGTPVRFPQPRLTAHRYDLDAAYPGVFTEIVAAIDKLEMARYRPSAYLRDQAEESAHENVLAALIQSGLLKRFESSVYAAHKTVERMVAAHELVLRALTEHDLVPGPEQLLELLAEDSDGWDTAELEDALLEACGDAWAATDFEDSFGEHLDADLSTLRLLRVRLSDLLQVEDPKLTALARVLQETPARKVVVFASYADTVAYLDEQLRSRPEIGNGRAMAVIHGSAEDAATRTHILERFCPRSMTDDPDFRPRDGEVDLLLSTDVVSEGQNLQDAQAVVSYDMPWNPQRVVQRNGRVIRLKSDFDEVFLATLLPADGALEEELELESKLRAKIAAANASIGMESEVLADAGAESRNYAELKAFSDRLVEGDADLLAEGEGGEIGSFAGEAYRHRLRRARDEGRLEELRGLPWGIGAAFRAATQPADVNLPGVFFACRTRADRRYWRFVDADGRVLTTDLRMLQLADPHGAIGEPEPTTIDLDAVWQVAVNDICTEHNAQLDPQTREARLPASQRWALQDILRSAEAPGGREFEQAHDALTVARPGIVLRDLSAIRHRQQDGELSVSEAAEEIASAVQRHGLRPMQVPDEPESEITPDDVGVVCYQIVLPPGSDA